MGLLVVQDGVNLTPDGAEGQSELQAGVVAARRRHPYGSTDDRPGSCEPSPPTTLTIFTIFDIFIM